MSKARIYMPVLTIVSWCMCSPAAKSAVPVLLFDPDSGHVAVHSGGEVMSHASVRLTDSIGTSHSFLGFEDNYKNIPIPLSCNARDLPEDLFMPPLQECPEFASEPVVIANDVEISMTNFLATETADVIYIGRVSPKPATPADFQSILTARYVGSIASDNGGVANSMEVISTAAICLHNNQDRCRESIETINMPNVVRGETSDAQYMAREAGLDTSMFDLWGTAAALRNNQIGGFRKGDANLDGMINAADLNSVAKGWLGKNKDSDGALVNGGVWSWSDGEFVATPPIPGSGEDEKYDLKDAADLNVVGQNWGVAFVPIFEVQDPVARTIVPEPVGVSPLLLALFLVLRGTAPSPQRN